LVELPVVHVWNQIPGYENPVTPGNCEAPDEKIAEWCGQNDRVLITVDQGFQGRWIRTGLLQDNGVEVVVFDKDVKGLDEQHRRIALHLPYWQAAMSRDPYGFRVWVQPHNQNSPVLREGKKRRPRSRPSKAVPVRKRP
jgi:hypothetical protein